MSPARPRPLGVAQAFGRIFRTWATALPQLLLVATLFQAPTALLRWFTHGTEGQATALGATARALPLAELALSALAKAGAVALVMQCLRGERPDAVASLRAGFLHLGRVLGITAILDAPYIVNVLLEVFFLEKFDLEVVAFFGAWNTSIGLFTLAVSICLCFPIPVVLIEERGVIASIRRCWQLTRGSKLAIFVLYLLLVLAASPLLAGVPFLVLELVTEGGVASFLLDQCANVVIASFICVIPVVLYHGIREAREGIGSERLAEVFD